MDNLPIIRIKIKTITTIMIMKYHPEIMAMKILIIKSIKKTYQIIKIMKSQSQETMHKMKTRMVRHFSEVTLSSLLSLLFYETTWSEFFQKVSIKRPGPSQKKSIVLFYFRATTANFWSLLNNLVWIL